MSAKALSQERPRIYWGRIAYKAVLHVGAGYAVYRLATEGFNAFPLIAWALFWLLALGTGFGVTLNLHRLMTHRSYICKSKKLRWVLMGFASMAGQGPEASWVAVHELHHRHSDQPGDPHSPLRFFPVVSNPQTGRSSYKTDIPWRSRLWRKGLGLAWAHILWALVSYSEDMAKEVSLLRAEYLDTTRPGLKAEQVRDIRIAVWQNRASVYLTLLFGLGYLTPGVIGGIVIGALYGPIAGLYGAALTVILAGFLRHVVVLHVTASVNSIGHLVGETPRYDCNCPYEKTNARNTRNPLMALLSIGERNHGNHHFMPRSAYFAPWLDPGKWLLILFERFGWVSDVKKPEPKECPIHKRMRMTVDAS